ncbi:hypothetical protein [Sphingomonas gei]|nr:hypothetical protein [Sphingomonas gei]
MLFSENAPFESALSGFAEDIRAHPVPQPAPLPCDRWIARSVLQKAIRRAEPVLAQRALANLFDHDRRATWRALVVIALEDVGIANTEVLARVVAAQRARTWRAGVGGDWAVLAELTRQMADSNHCQAACDLLLRATNDTALQRARADALEMDIGSLIATMADSAQPMVMRGLSALAAGGGLIEGHVGREPVAIFETLAELCHFSPLVTICRDALRISRNPMALLFPLILQEHATADEPSIADDPMPPVQFISHIPGYALDQFTRRGNAVSRAVLAESGELTDLLTGAGFRTGEHASAVGDLIFLREGGNIRNRMVWPVGDQLRLPYRWLPAVPRLGSNLAQALRLIEAQGSQIENLRHGHLTTGSR